MKNFAIRLAGVAAIVAAVSCGSGVASTVPIAAVAAITNSRPDTITKIVETACDQATIDTSNVLGVRGVLLPGGTRVLQVALPCIDLDFLVGTAVVDTRPHIALALGDTLAIVLRK